MIISETAETKPMKFNYESGAITVLTDWRHLAMLEKVDFGWKEAVNSMPVPCGFVQDPAS